MHLPSCTHAPHAFPMTSTNAHGRTLARALGVLVIVGQLFAMTRSP